MKLVHYFPYLLREETGTSNSALQWCEALSRAGSDVTVIVDENSLGREGPAGGRCIPVPHRFGGRWHTPVNIGEALVSADLFVVHGGWTARNIVACRGASERGIPYVVTTHGVYNPRVLERGSLKKRVWNAVLERRHLSHAFAIHMFFPEETEGLRRLRVSTPTLVVPNGMSYRADALWDGGSGGYLLWLGRFDPEVKALDLLIESYLHLAEEERPLLRLHGRDWKGQKAKVATLVRELDLEAWITVGEPVYGEDKWRLISAASRCVYPSRWDASPMAVAEAVACGATSKETP
jgi:glycosyltransferase involved in cell wall biosynthesis